jgi:hypothetical protein
MTALPADAGGRLTAPSRQSVIRLPLLIAVLAVLAISLNEYQIFYQIHTVAGKELIEVSRGVLDRHPPWRAFQARLLGPLSFAGFEAAMEWIRTTSPAVYSVFERIFSLPDTRDLAILNGFVAGMVVAKDFLCFVLLLRYTGSLVKAAGGTILGGILFVLVSNHWLYMWDLFELIFFCYLAYVIFGEKKLTAGFFLVYILALTNRESAGFFGVWLLCYAAARRLVGDRTPWAEAGLGIVLIVVTVLYVMVLRQALLVESTLGHEVGSAWGSSPIHTDNGAIHQALGNHLLILENGVTFLKNLVSTHFYVNVYVVALALHAGILARVGMRRRDSRLVAIGAFNLILLVSILNFAALNETRLFLICVPFLVFSVVTFSGEISAFLARVDRQSAVPSLRTD